MAKFPAPPVSIPLTGSMEQRVRVLADAVGRKADVTSEPMYSAVLLQAPGGVVWRVTVDDAGGLITAVVPRS